MGFKEFWKYLVTDSKKDKSNSKSKSVSNLNKKFKKKNSKLTVEKESRSEEHNVSESTSTKKLSNKVILFVLINSILGSSLFYLPSLGVKSSGAASIIAWVLTFLFASFVMMYIGELTVLHPTSGGTYAFCKRAYGRFLSFMAGWLIWIAGNLGMALSIVAAAEYFIPEAGQAAFYLRILFSIVWIIALNYMAYRGIDAGVTMLVAFGIFSVVVVTMMVIPSFIDIPGLFNGVLASPFDIELMKPFFQWEGLGVFSYLLFSMFLIMEAFFGFETITYMANEAEKPKELHKMLFLSMAICGSIMFLYILSSLGTVSLSDYVNDARPFAVQVANTLGNAGQNFVVFGMYLVIIGAAAAWPITSSRLLQAMAKDKLFLTQLAVRHKKHKSPYRAVIFQTVVISLFTWLIFRGYIVKWGDPYRTLYLIYILLGLLVLSLILFAVPILRKKEKYVERVYKAPLPLAGPIIIVSFFLLLILNWMRIEGGIAWSIINLAGSFVILGIPFYFLVEMYYDPKAIIKVNEILSYGVLATEKFYFPVSIRKYVLEDLKNLKGKNVLEFGCNVGSLTKRLVPLVGNKGKIVATDVSLHNVKVVDKRTKQVKNVFVHHHPHLHKFKLSVKGNFDEVISVGALSSLQKPLELLTGMARKLKKNAQITFVDYDKFFYILPNVNWIENDKQLISLFKKAGFKVEVTRKRSLLWTYIIIKGKKI